MEQPGKHHHTAESFILGWSIVRLQIFLIFFYHSSGFVLLCEVTCREWLRYHAELCYPRAPYGRHDRNDLAIHNVFIRSEIDGPIWPQLHDGGQFSPKAPRSRGVSFKWIRPSPSYRYNQLLLRIRDKGTGFYSG